MNPPRVLVVEDRPSVLKLIATVLERAYDVTAVSGSAAALSLIGSERFDVVLTDVRMPGASGFEVLRAVRARAPSTRVVMITAYANVADAVAAMRLGAFDYVAKPMDADEMALVVARAVEGGSGAASHDVGSGVPPPAQPIGGDSSGDDLSKGFHRAVEEARDRASREYLLNLMRLFGGNVTRAAAQAGMTRESLHRVLRKYGVRSEAHKESREPGAEAPGGASDDGDDQGAGTGTGEPAHH